MIHNKMSEKHINTVLQTFNVGVNPSNVSVTPNGKYAYVTNSNNYAIPKSDTVTVLNLRKGIPKLTIQDDSFIEPYRIAIDNNGIYGYVCNSGSPSSTGSTGTISIINLKTNKVSGVIVGFDGPGGIALSIKNAYVTNYGAPGGVQSGNGTTVSVVDLKTNKIIDTIQVDLAPSALVLSPCHNFLYVICYVDGNPGTGILNVICTKTNNVIIKIPGFSGPFGIALSTNGHYAYVTNFGSNNFAPYGTTLSVVNLKKQCIIKNIEVGIQPAGIAVSKKFAYVSNYNTLYADPNYQNLTPGEGTISIICLKNNELVRPTISIGQSPSSLALSPDGKRLYVCKYIQNTVAEIYLE